MATKKEQVAFELENPGGFVTQASEIGYGEKTVEEELVDSGERVLRLAQVLLGNSGEIPQTYTFTLDNTLTNGYEAISFPIKNGDKIRVQVTTDSPQGVAIFGKNATSDTDYATIVPVTDAATDGYNQVLIVSTSSDINYIKIQHKGGSVANTTVVFTQVLESGSGLVDDVSVLQTKVNQIQNSVFEDVQEQTIKDMTLGLYKIVNGVPTFATSQNVGYKIIPTSGLKHLQTIATSSTSNTKAPAIIFLTTDDVTSYIPNSWIWDEGTFPTVFDQDITVPSSANYALINCYINVSGLTPSTLKITYSESLKNIVNESLEAMNNELEDINSSINGENIDYSDTDIHAYITLGGSSITNSSTSDCTDFVAVSQGDKFEYGGISGNNISPVFGYSDNNFGNPQALLEPTGNVYTESEFIIPSGVNYIRAWSRNSTHATTPATLKLVEIISKGIEERMDDIDNDIEDLKEVSPIIAPQAFNGYPLPYRPQTLKILSVGNSYIQRPMMSLVPYLTALGITNVIYGYVVKASCTLAMYSENIETNTKNLWLGISENGADFVPVNAETRQEVSYDNRYCSCLRDALLYEDWDIITFQQESSNSGKWNTIEPYIGGLIASARYYCKNSGVKIGWHQTWASANGFTDRLRYYNNSQTEMFNAIVDVSKKIVEKFGLDLVIPSGAIVQSLRGISNSFWGADLLDIKGADTYSVSTPQADFMVDGYHPTPYTLYAICGGIVQLLINSCLGKTIRGCTATYEDAVGDFAKVARQTALKCIGNRYNISIIDTTNLE